MSNNEPPRERLLEFAEFIQQWIASMPGIGSDVLNNYSDIFSATAEKPVQRRYLYLCERCGGTGEQQAGCWTGKSYDSLAGTCELCGGSGELGRIHSSKSVADNAASAAPVSDARTAESVKRGKCLPVECANGMEDSSNEPLTPETQSDLIASPVYESQDAQPPEAIQPRLPQSDAEVESPAPLTEPIIRADPSDTAQDEFEYAVDAVRVPPLRLPKRDCELGTILEVRLRWNSGSGAIERLCSDGEWIESEFQPDNLFDNFPDNQLFIDRLSEQAAAQEAEDAEIAAGLADIAAGRVTRLEDAVNRECVAQDAEDAGKPTYDIKISIEELQNMPIEDGCDVACGASSHPWDAKPRWPREGDFVGARGAYDFWLLAGGTRCEIGMGSNTWWNMSIIDAEKPRAYDVEQECAAACRKFIAAYPWKGPQRFKHPTGTFIGQSVNRPECDYFIEGDKINGYKVDWLSDQVTHSKMVPVSEARQLDDRYAEAAEYAQRWIAAHDGKEFNAVLYWEERTREAVADHTESLKELESLRQQLAEANATIAKLQGELLKKQSHLVDRDRAANKGLDTIRQSFAALPLGLDDSRSLPENIRLLRDERDAIKEQLEEMKIAFESLRLAHQSQLAKPSLRTYVEGVLSAAARAGISITMCDDTGTEWYAGGDGDEIAERTQVFTAALAGKPPKDPPLIAPWRRRRHAE